MDIDKADITTYTNGSLLAIFTYAGISQTTSNLLVQILAPIAAVGLGLVMSYINEKYPSAMVTDPTEGMVPESEIQSEEPVDGI